MEVAGAVFIVMAMCIAAVKMASAGVATLEAVNELATGEEAEHRPDGCAATLIAFAVVMVLFFVGGILIGGITL